MVTLLLLPIFLDDFLGKNTEFAFNALLKHWRSDNKRYSGLLKCVFQFCIP